MRVVVFVLIAFLASFVCEAEAQNQALSDAPPRLSLIRVSTPTPEGAVTVTGAPGAVSAGNLIALVTLDTGHFVTTRSAADGSFSQAIFAPAGTSILVKDFKGANFVNVFSIERWPGAILRVPDSTASEPALAFAGAGLTGPTSNPPVECTNVVPPAVQ